MAATGIQFITARYLKTRPSRLALDVGDAVPGRKPCRPCRERNAAVWGRTMRRRGAVNHMTCEWTIRVLMTSPSVPEKIRNIDNCEVNSQFVHFFPCFFQVNYMWIPNVPSTKRVFFPVFFSSGAKTTTQTYDIFRAEHQGQGARHGIFFLGKWASFITIGHH